MYKHVQERKLTKIILYVTQPKIELMSSSDQRESTELPMRFPGCSDNKKVTHASANAEGGVGGE